MSIYRITFGGMTNESTNINNGENNSDDEPTVVTRSSSILALSFRVPVHRIRKLSFPLLLMTPPSVRTVEYRGRWKCNKNSYYFND